MPHVDPSKGTHEIASHKRTVYIDGRKTGISIEAAFWSALKKIADAQGGTTAACGCHNMH
jgi:predicted DNA-binding ribbon-helix-helix protein